MMSQTVTVTYEARSPFTFDGRAYERGATFTASVDERQLNRLIGAGLLRRVETVVPTGDPPPDEASTARGTRRGRSAT